MKETKRLYEGMYIVSAQLSEDARSRVRDRIVEGIEAEGGKIEKIHEMGRKKLAYEISGHREGYYYLIYFTVNSLAVEKLWKDYRLNEDLIRFMTSQADSVLESLEFKSLVQTS